MAMVSPLRHSIAAKVAGAAALVLLAQLLFYGHEPGGTLGLFALAWCAVLALAVPALRRGVPAMVLGLAAAFALLLVDDPGPLAWLLFWTSLTSATLLPRRTFDDAISWAARVAGAAPLGVIGLCRDLARRHGAGGRSPANVARVAALPLAGAALFLALFAAANPVLGRALARVAPPSLWDVVFHLLFWSIVVAVVWPSLRPRTPRLAGGLIPAARRAPDLSIATLVLSLAAFNAVFALQNALDLAFLWSGAALPDGVTLADYAHQGAYTLIATVLIAAAFVLVALAPGSRAAASPAVRRLLLAWIAQNLLLVASSALRLADYIGAYLLTEWRIAALAWMALVAVGLVLVCWRVFTGRGAAWLVNACALAGALVVVAGDVADPGAIAARWNVDHARRADQLDLCYLNRLGAAALLPLIDLERRAAGPVLRDRVRAVRRDTQAALALAQADWHQWSARGARRLAAARALVGRDAAPLRPAPHGRACDGTVLPPPARLTEGGVR